MIALLHYKHCIKLGRYRFVVEKYSVFAKQIFCTLGFFSLFIYLFILQNQNYLKNLLFYIYFSFFRDILGGDRCKSGGLGSGDSSNEDGDSNSRKSPDDSLYRLDIKSESHLPNEQPTTSHHHQQQLPPQQQPQQQLFRFSIDTMPHQLSPSSMSDLELRMVADYQSL